MAQDLTVIYITANRHPEGFTAYQRQVLRQAIGDFPLISVSRQPIDFGHNLLDTGEYSHINMYRQLMEAAKVATTPYIAMAEDDVLYHPEHFTFFRPPLDTFAYDMSRWSLYTWRPDIFSIKQRVSNSTLIAPRELFIDAWEERFDTYPGNSMPPYFVGEVGRQSYEKQMGLIPRKIVKPYCHSASIHINHPNGLDSTGLKKRAGEMKAIEIPYWGRAIDVAKRYA